MHDNNLFLGSVAGLNDPEFLRRELGVTAVVSIAPQLTPEFKAKLANVGFPQGVHYEDGGSSHRSFRTDPAICGRLVALVVNLVSSGAVVFLHCRSGMHRSVAVATGYLMVRELAPWDRAFQFVRCARPCASDRYRTLVELALGRVDAD